MLKKSIKKEKRIKKEKIRLSGYLGGETSNLGFGTLEAAKEYINNSQPWNQEEAEMLREQITKKRKHSNLPRSSHNKYK